jgi:hypothetical protein
MILKTASSCSFNSNNLGVCETPLMQALKVSSLPAATVLVTTLMYCTSTPKRRRGRRKNKKSPAGPGRRIVQTARSVAGLHKGKRGVNSVEMAESGSSPVFVKYLPAVHLGRVLAYSPLEYVMSDSSIEWQIMALRMV